MMLQIVQNSTRIRMADITITTTITVAVTITITIITKVTTLLSAPVINRHLSEECDRKSACIRILIN